MSEAQAPALPGKPAPTYYLTRAVFQRALAFIYFVAFLIAVNQFRALAGEHGIEPLGRFLKLTSFSESPSLVWAHPTDGFLALLSWVGLGLAAFALSGFSERLGMTVSVLTWFLLWALYFSLVNVGQEFYGFGWEMLLLETGFMAMFLGSRSTRPPVVVLWLIIWEAFRIMLGAGLIKIRNDHCWLDCTCLFYHYETQPSPSPLSWFLHQAPPWWHRFEVGVNHFVELVVPFFFFTPRLIRRVAAAITIFFQAMLIVSGNLSWFNYLTIVLCLPCFDDGVWARFLPRAREAPPMTDARKVILALLCLSMAFVSVEPVKNFFAKPMQMNAKYNALFLGNSYGAFGHIDRDRYEVIIEGSPEADASRGDVWREYEFHTQPGDPAQGPPFVSPYHYKLDWQLWFVPERVPLKDGDDHFVPLAPTLNELWFLSFLERLLENDPGVIGLLPRNPFPDKPPQRLRVRVFRYTFTKWGEPGWWHREELGLYVPPVSLKELQATLTRFRYTY